MFMMPMAYGEVLSDERSPINTCNKGTLRPAVERLLKPVLLARVDAKRSGHYGGKAFDDAFYKLLEMKGTTAFEAKVALMSYYTGEHYGKELVEAVLEKPNQADPLVRRYEKCRPRVTFENQLDDMVVLRTLYEIYGAKRARQKELSVWH